MGLSVYILLGFILGISSSQLQELTDSFSEIRKEGGFWLVKFYAPWCGHCKKLEPVWDQVRQSLARSEVQVRKVDCSRFPVLASEFGIRGYPTIKFITKDSEFTFNGDRNKDDIVNFAIRMAGPAIFEITQPENLLHILNNNQIFFLYVGDQKDDLWKNFEYVASKLQPHSYFYVTTHEIAKQHLKVPETPSVLVHKENLTYNFTVGNIENEANNLNASLYNWINVERFETFPKITRGNINEILQTNKYVVMIVVEENKSRVIPEDMLKFLDKAKNLAKNNREKFHQHFQFGWVGNPELANSIATEILSLPHILVINSTNYYHYVPEEDVAGMTSEDIETFLEKIYNQSIPARGGNGIAARLYRTYFDATIALVDMWNGNPILTVVLFGLPFTFICFILYSICCADIMDADEEEEEEHSKIE